MSPAGASDLFDETRLQQLISQTKAAIAQKDEEAVITDQVFELTTGFLDQQEGIPEIDSKKEY